MELEFSAKTDTGIKRDHNEDAYGVFPELNLFLACDGMGGHSSGYYASAVAVETIDKINQEYSRELFNKVKSSYKNIPEGGKRLLIQVMLANRRLFRLAVMYPKLRGMGTTLTAAMFAKGYVNIVNVGDSRTYLFRDSKLQRLTVDHSWVEEMLQDGEIKEQELDDFRAKNVITRALGTNPAVKIDYKSVETQKDDIYLLCSDGLCGEIDDKRIEGIIKKGSGDLEKISDDLIEAAKKAGGSDNITAVLVKLKSSESVAEEIEPDRIVSVRPDKPVLDTMDEYIDKYLSPQKASVPKGVEKEKKKIYQNPLFVTLCIFILILSGAALFTRTKYGRKVVFSGAEEISLGDILIRTDPPDAEVSIRGAGGYSDEKRSPADFVGLEEGSYEVVIEKEGHEKETVKIYLRKGVQESRNIELSPQQQLFLTIGTYPGFEASEVVYVNDEPFMYYGRPLTVGRIGFTGKKMHLSADRRHVIRIGEKVKEIDTGVRGDPIEIKVENGDLKIVD